MFRRLLTLLTLMVTAASVGCQTELAQRLVPMTRSLRSSIATLVEPEPIPATSARAASVAQPPKIAQPPTADAETNTVANTTGEVKSEADRESENETAGAESQPQSTAERTVAASGYLRDGPVLTGAELPTNRQKTSTERALELRAENERLQAHNKELQNRVKQLQEEQVLDQLALAEARDRVKTVRMELAAVRKDLKSWRQEMTSLRTRLGGREKAHLEQLDQLLSQLRAMIRHYEPPDTQAPAKNEEGQTAPSSPDGWHPRRRPTEARGRPEGTEETASHRGSEPAGRR